MNKIIEFIKINMSFIIDCLFLIIITFSTIQHSTIETIPRLSLILDGVAIGMFLVIVCYELKNIISKK